MIWLKAKNSIAIPKNENVEIEIKFVLEEIKMLQNNLKEMNEKIKSFSLQSEDYKLLLTIPGFGPVITSIFLAHVGNIENYSKASQLTKLAGLDLEYKQSGKYHGKAKISKKGNSLLRYALCSAANHAKKNKIIKLYFTKKNNSKAFTTKLRIKLADKLLRAAYAVLKNKTPFNVNQFVNPVC